MIQAVRDLTADAQDRLAIERDPAERVRIALELAREVREHAEELTNPEAAALRDVLRTIVAALSGSGS